MADHSGYYPVFVKSKLFKPLVPDQEIYDIIYKWLYKLCPFPQSSDPDKFLSLISATFTKIFLISHALMTLECFLQILFSSFIT